MVFNAASAEHRMVALSALGHRCPRCRMEEWGAAQCWVLDPGLPPPLLPVPRGVAPRIPAALLAPAQVSPTVSGE